MPDCFGSVPNKLRALRVSFNLVNSTSMHNWREVCSPERAKTGSGGKVKRIVSFDPVAMTQHSCKNMANKLLVHENFDPLGISWRFRSKPCARRTSDDKEHDPKGLAAQLWGGGSEDRTHKLFSQKKQEKNANPSHVGGVGRLWVRNGCSGLIRQGGEHVGGTDKDRGRGSSIRKGRAAQAGIDAGGTRTARATIWQCVVIFVCEPNENRLDSFDGNIWLTCSLDMQVERGPS